MAFLNQSTDELKAQAAVTAADVAAAKAFVRSLSFDGQMVKDGRVVLLKKEILKQLWDAIPAEENGSQAAVDARSFVFDRDVQGFYLPNGKPMLPEAVKAASEMVTNEHWPSELQLRQAAVRSQFRIYQGTLDLQSGAIDLNAWFEGMKDATKTLHVSQGALGAGGWEGVTEGTLSRLESVITDTWLGNGRDIKGLLDFAQRLDAKEYGARYESGLVRSRAHQYVIAGRITKENESIATAKDAGMLEFRRILAAVDNCGGCQAAAARGWVPIEDADPFGGDPCGSGCCCTGVTRRTRREFVTLPDSEVLASVE
jgi:hypothetical protein